MNTNSKFLCGLPSSSKPHRPHIRRQHRAERLARKIGRIRAEWDRIRKRDARDGVIVVGRLARFWLWLKAWLSSCIR